MKEDHAAKAAQVAMFKRAVDHLNTHGFTIASLIEANRIAGAGYMSDEEVELRATQVGVDRFGQMMKDTLSKRMSQLSKKPWQFWK